MHKCYFPRIFQSARIDPQGSSLVDYKLSSPEVTVAVSTYKETNLNWVKELLEALKYQTYKNFIVLLVVNENKNYYHQLLRYTRTYNDLRIKLVFNPEDHGIAYARNTALKHSNSPYVAFTDDDALPTSDWLTELIHVFRTNEKVVSVTGPIKPIWETPKLKKILPDVFYWIVGCTIWSIEQLAFIRNGFASNLAFKRDLALMYGGFNDEFGYKRDVLIAGEEPEFAIRLRKNGYFTVWNPMAVVYHRVNANRLKLKAITRRAYSEGKTKALLSKRYGKDSLELEARVLLKLPLSMIRTSIRGVLYSITALLAIGFGYFMYRLQRS